MVRAGLWLQTDPAQYSLWVDVRYPAISLTVTILRHQRPWRRYALYRVPFYFSNVSADSPYTACVAVYV